MMTEFGKIAQSLESVETSRTPLQQNLDRVGNILARAALVIVVVIAGLGLLRGLPFLEMLIFSIALAVAVVPEALPAVVTISLALGVQRMSRRHALIRRLSAVETLGSVSVICSDKTGTLTKDEMTARKIFVAGRMLAVSGKRLRTERCFHGSRTSHRAKGAAVESPLRAGALASDAHLVRASDHGLEDQRRSDRGRVGGRRGEGGAATRPTWTPNFQGSARFHLLPSRSG